MTLGNNLAAPRQAGAGRPGPAIVAQPDPALMLAPLRPLIEGADVVLLNVEGAIGEGPAPSKCRAGAAGCYAFRQPVAAASALVGLVTRGAVVGNVANNHAMDAGLAGLQATIAHLRQAGAQVTGADTLATLVVTSAADSIAVLGFSTFQAGPSARDLEAVRRHVARAFARHRRVVVSVHMGAEGAGAQRTPDANERFLGEDRGNPVAFARAALESGAALVIGHGPHVLRAAEWRGDALVFYSLGNLVTYGPFNLREPLNRGAIACAVLDEAGRIGAAWLSSTYQLAPGQVASDPTGRGAVIVDSLSRVDFPLTGASLAPDGSIRRPALRR